MSPSAQAELLGLEAARLVLPDLDVRFDAQDVMIMAGLAIMAERADVIEADLRDERGDRRPTAKITDERFYLVSKLADGWKVDPHAVDRPHVGGSEIYRAVLDRGVRTIDELRK